MALALTWLLLGFVYADTVFAMWQLWNGSETFAHAILVPPISAWLVWRRRAELAMLVPRPQPRMLLPIGAFALMWLMAKLVLVNAGMQFAWLAMFVLAVPALLGLHVSRVILFPLLFLFFAVPIGEFLLQPMMDRTADFTVAALRLSGIPVFREGNQFVIPSGTWSVVEACSGVRYLIASFMVGTLFAHLNYRSWQRRLMFMLVAIAVPILGNWVRAYSIVMLGHLSGNTLAVGVDHLIYGWVFFGVVVLLMFMIGARWAESEAPSVLSQPMAGFAVIGSPGSRTAPLHLALLACVTLGVMASPWLGLRALQQAEQGAAAPSLVLPDQLGSGWQAATGASPLSAAEFKPRFDSPALARQRVYAHPDGEVAVFIAYYRHQDADSKLVTSVNSLVPSGGRWILAESGVARSGAGDAGVTWRTGFLLDSAGVAGVRQQLSSWRSYWIDGSWVAGDIQAKLAAAVARLRGRGDDGAVLVFWTNEASRPKAQALLQQFSKDNLPRLERLLAETQARR